MSVEEAREPSDAPGAPEGAGAPSRAGEQPGGAVVGIELRGRPCTVASGRSVLAAALDEDPESAPPVICGMGSCYACVVTRNGHEQVRSCITQVQEGDSYEW